MSSIRNHYRERLKWKYILPSILLFLLVIVYFLFIDKIYHDKVYYFDNNRESIFTEYKKQTEDEVWKKNKEEFDKPLKEQKRWVVDKDKLESSFESYVIGQKNLVLYIFGSIVVIVLFGSFALAVFIIEKRPIYCPHCYKTVVRNKIIPFICPFCEKENIEFKSIYTHCSDSGCKSPIPSILCPQCKEQIDLLGEYDINKIKEKRYGKKTKI